MVPALQALLERLIDYAGLFPPASLQMEQAVEKFRAHRRSPHAWMLARFICPGQRLPQLGDLLQSGEPRWSIAMLCRGGDTPAAFDEGLAADLDAAAAFAGRGGGSVDALEARLPESALAEGPAAVSALVRSAAERTARAGLDAPFFFEINPDAGNGQGLEAGLDGLYAARQGPGRPLQVGAKLRTGGVTAAMFPSCAAVARFISGCRERELAMKATAGLHHPLRRFDPAMGAAMHGFINVFTAAALADYARLEAAELAGVLASEDPQAFQFDEDGLCWGSHRVPAAAITRSRSRLAAGFGSCSFDEPVDDLLQLGWLRPTPTPIH